MRMPTRWRLWWLMAVVALAAFGLFVGREFGPGWVASYREWKACRPIHNELGKTVALKLPAGISLDKMLVAVTAATKSKELPAGIPIVIDPVGLQEAGANMNTPVEMPDRGVKLKTGLREALKRLGLVYSVRQGMLTITAEGSMDE